MLIAASSGGPDQRSFHLVWLVFRRAGAPPRGFSRSGIPVCLLSRRGVRVARELCHSRLRSRVLDHGEPSSVHGLSVCADLSRLSLRCGVNGSRGWQRGASRSRRLRDSCGLDPHLGDHSPGSLSCSSPEVTTSPASLRRRGRYRSRRSTRSLVAIIPRPVSTVDWRTQRDAVDRDSCCSRWGLHRANVPVEDDRPADRDAAVPPFGRSGSLGVRGACRLGEQR